MRVLSVNVGERRTQPKGPELEITGIYKRPTEGPAPITTRGVAGDFIGDVRHHGGPDQAVYVYGTMDYDWWGVHLGRRLAPGTFGENLTITGLESAQLRIGDRLHVGKATLEISAARIPCATLSRRMGDFGFAAAFRNAERPGMYCRVIFPGVIKAGDDVLLEPWDGEAVSVIEMFRAHYRRGKDQPLLHRLLKAPISTRARQSLQAELDQLLSAQEP